MPRVIGEAHPSAKLTEEKVREMRRLKADGLSYEALAYLFGVSLRTTYEAVTGRSWKHVN